jgi:RNA polymerase sigma-70 factor (ECF subfamily)
MGALRTRDTALVFFANALRSRDVSMGMKGNPTANMEALLAEAGWLRRFARALVHDADDADDLAQDTLVRALPTRALPTMPGRPAAGGRAWLATVARRLAVDRFRSGARLRRRHAIAADDGLVANPEELIANAQIHRHVAEAVASLAEPFRHTLVLRFYQGLTSAEIARQLREPEGTVRWRVKEGLDRVRHELDRRHDRRGTWVAALGPLLPRPATQPPERPARPPRQLWRSRPFTLLVAAGALGLLSTAAFLLLSQARRPAADLPRARSSTSTTPVVARTSARTVHLSLATASTPTDAAPTLPPGPGPADAQSLVEELLAAIQGKDYDAFVAKGSAGFRAGVATGGFAHLSDKVGGRLSRAHRVTTLGVVRRPEHVDWFFKIEFSDDGDDALVTLPLDGWQVAGFLITDPFPMPVETAP